MGWCHEFGVEIEERCSHPMTAGATTCSCTECGTVCRGRFEGGCEAVWRRGPRRDAPERPSRGSLVSLPLAGANGSLNGGLRVETHETRVNGVNPKQDVFALGRVKELQEALANLAGEVARQAEHQITLEQRLDDLGKVLGQLGVEVDDRVGRLEQQAEFRAGTPPRPE